MKMDFSKFKKLASDGKTTTLQHPDGHKIVLAHSALSPKLRGQLAEIPMAKGGAVKAMADGGDTSDDSGTDQPAAAPQIPAININLGGGQPQMPASLINPNPGAEAIARTQAAAPPVTTFTPGDAAHPPDVYGIDPEQWAKDHAPQTPAPAATPSDTAAPNPTAQPSTGASDPYGTQAYNDAFMHGLGEQKAGLAAEGKAAQAEGDAQQAALQPAIQKQQESIQNYQQHYSSLDGERQRFMQAFEHQQIDPQHYLNNMTTGKRIATAIGLIAGGIGGALTHSPNAAQEFLNAQIDRDINAQKANLGKTQSLLDLNMKQFGNLRDATDMTRVMSSDVVSNQLKAAAAKSIGPLTKARLLQEAGKLDQQAAPVLSQIAMRRTLLSGMQAGQVAPENVVRMIVPQQEQAAAYKELQSAQNLAKGRDNLLSAFDQLGQINTVGNRVTSPVQTPKQVAAIRDPLLAQLVKDSEGRITPQDTDMIKALFPAPGDSADTSATKRAQLTKFVTEKMNFPLLRAYGINLGNSGRFNNQGQSRIQFKPAE